MDQPGNAASNLAPALWSTQAEQVPIVPNGSIPQPTMQYACQSCASRKIKCDKAAPICSACRRARLECIYQAPPPRRRKRKLSGDGSERLARYERILRQHDLLPAEDDESPLDRVKSNEEVSLRITDPPASRTGKLVAGDGKSRYVSSNLWRNLEDEELQHMSEEDDDEQASFAFDPLTGAFMGYHLDLLQYHPSPSEAITLWRIYVESVEPLCKILHIPSVQETIERLSQHFDRATKAEECLLFSIYHFAVFTMTDQDCEQRIGRSRTSLMQIYHFAVRQALVNASFLKTTEMSVLQAFVLFLIPCRYTYDAHTYWILTGVAIRIAQRMGIHRDGENLGLPPFEVQMRRRLFYQMIPLDGIASQVAGTGIAIDSWDTQEPLNLNDVQLWPGMTELPPEEKGATEMIFCLVRSCIGKYFAKPGTGISGPWPFKDYIDVETTMKEAENEVEERYIRYCDVVNPLHFLTICQARTAIAAMRLRVRLPKIRNQTATDTERKEILEICQKIIDADTTACANASLRPFLWHIRSFFAWGSWDSITFVLTSIRRPNLLSTVETDAAWNRVEQVYSNRAELLESKRALPQAIGRLALKAWAANPRSNRSTEPTFINTLRGKQEARRKSLAERKGSKTTSLDSKSSVEPSPSSDAMALFDSLPIGMGLELGNDFSIDTADWMFWDSLIRDYQFHTTQQQGLVG